MHAWMHVRLCWIICAWFVVVLRELWINLGWPCTHRWRSLSPQRTRARSGPSELNPVASLRILDRSAAFRRLGYCTLVTSFVFGGVYYNLFYFMKCAARREWPLNQRTRALCACAVVCALAADFSSARARRRSPRCRRCLASWASSRRACCCLCSPSASPTSALVTTERERGDRDGQRVLLHNADRVCLTGRS